jgi:hypothetical protein
MYNDNSSESRLGRRSLLQAGSAILHNRHVAPHNEVKALEDFIRVKANEKQVIVD